MRCMIPYTRIDYSLAGSVITLASESSLLPQLKVVDSELLIIPATLFPATSEVCQDALGLKNLY
jgi:hypothetical protein